MYTSRKHKLILILLGFLSALIILEIGLRVGGWFVGRSHFKKYVSIQKHAKENGDYRILCLGESTTGMTEHNSYPSFLENELNSRKIGLNFEVINKGVWSTNSDIIVNNLQSYIDDIHPDMVIVMMGINDDEMQIDQDYIVAEHVEDNNTENPKQNIFRSLHSLRVYKLSQYLFRHYSRKIRPLEEHRAKTFERHLHALKTSPNNHQLYMELGKHYWDVGDRELSQKMFAKGYNLEPEYIYKYFDLLYRDAILPQDDIKNWLSFFPDDVTGLFEFAKYMYAQKNDSKTAHNVFEEISTLEPNHPRLLVEKGLFYGYQGDLKKSEDAFKRSIHLFPLVDEAYFELALIFWNTERYEEFDEIMNKARAVPSINIADFLTDVFEAEGLKKENLDYALETLLQVDKNHPKNIKVNGLLAYIYQQKNFNELSLKYYKKSQQLRSMNHHPVTLKNYRKLNQILSNRDIKKVYMQYPMRNINHLRSMFQQSKDIVFVDNEKLFNDAVHKHGYDFVFIDRFAFDFGHATVFGNQLMAGNIADILVEHVFK